MKCAQIHSGLSVYERRLWFSWICLWVVKSVTIKVRKDKIEGSLAKEKLS